MVTPAITKRIMWEKPSLFISIYPLLDVLVIPETQKCCILLIRWNCAVDMCTAWQMDAK
jgi:hypothetical protein